MKKILFLGFGNMGQAIASGLLKEEGAFHIDAVDPYLAEQGSPFKEVQVYADASEVTQAYDLVVLAVKPQIAAQVYPMLNSLIQEGGAALSIMAGIPRSQIQTHMNEDRHVVRSMPNTPAAVGLGMSVLVGDASLSSEVKALCTTVLEAVGEVIWTTSEDQMHAVTAVSGSGPAYFFALMDAMTQAGVSLGLDEAMARKLACVTAKGAGALAVNEVEHGKTPLQLKQAVTSKGGTTEAALNVFEKNQFDRLVKAALDAAEQRSRELSI